MINIKVVLKSNSGDNVIISPERIMVDGKTLIQWVDDIRYLSSKMREMEYEINKKLKESELKTDRLVRDLTEFWSGLK